MTPDQIRAVVTELDTRVDVLISALQGAGPLLAGLFPDGHLIVDPVSARTETPDGVTVTGTGASGPFTGMTVTVAFTGLPDGVRVNATAAGDQNWTFTQAFPPLQFSIFDTLRFQSPVLTLDSAAAAMTFGGTLIITTPMAPLDLMMPGVTHAVTGEVTTVSGPPDLGFPTATVPNILLYGPEGATLNVGLFRLTDLRYEITADPVFDYNVIDWTVEGSVTITGAVPVTVGGKQHDVLISTQIFGWGEKLLFWGDFTALGDISLADVAGIAKQSDLAIPFDVSVTSPVKLTEVTVLAAPATASVDFICLEVQTQEEWDVVPGLLHLDAIDLTFRVDSPLSPRLSGTLSGLFGIGENGTLELTADFGQHSFGGALRQGDGPLSIREVYTSFTGDPQPPVPDLSVASFDFELTIPAKDRPLAYSGFLDLAGSWQISDVLWVTDVNFSLRHDQDLTTFQALAALEIAKVNVNITASYDSAPDKQWEFTGDTGPGQQIAIGGLFKALGDRFGALTLPEPIARLVIENIGVIVSTGTPRLYLTCEAPFPIDTATADIVLAIDTAARRFGARLTVTVPTAHGPFTPRFDMQFAGQQDAGQTGGQQGAGQTGGQQGADLFAATYSHSADDPVPQLKDLVAAVLPSAAAYVPGGLTVDLRDAFIAVTSAAYLFGADLSVTVDFSHLPVLGDHLSLGVMGFDPLRLVAVSAALTEEQAKAINGLLPTQVSPLPDGNLAAGFRFDGLLKLGALEQPMAMPVTDQTAQLPQPAQPAQPAAAKDTQAADNALWYKVQRSFGPVYLDRIGVAYLHVPNQSAQVALLVDASLTVAGLTLSLTGLRVGLQLSAPVAPSFDLAGLGLSYRQGPVEITGSFLKDTIEYDGHPYTGYGGQLVIRTTDLSIGAIGCYLPLPDGPSLFVYAFLDHALGGPAFFFVRGLAAGFGYNRRLIPPTLDTLADFPLIAEAAGGTQPATSLSDELQRLDAALPPSPGDFFLTAGVRFTSFEMIDSFLLLVVSFGHRFELDLLGLSTLILPAADAKQPGVTPVAHVQLALRATLVPDDGVFSVSAQLTPDSYLLSRDCHLFGGFAFSSWFPAKNSADSGQLAGDFVLTVGGYHPHFSKPAHYPAVPRLGFTWQVSPQLQLTGTAYYALTPSALMAGGSFSATYQDDSLRAWFDASMDFLISWQPYHYEASLHVAIGASYTFEFFGTHTITVHVGADVNLWGPDFGGTAFIDLSIISFTIAFGAGPSGPRQIDWAGFRDTLLPARAQVTTVALSGGALMPGSGDDLGVVDPYTLELRTDSVIPSSSAYRGAQGRDAPLPTGSAGLTFGVSPAGLAATTAVHRIEISHGGGPVDQLFGYTPVSKRLPYSLWGGVLRPSLDGPQLTGDLLTGYQVRPLPPAEPTTSPSLPASALQSPTPLYTEHGAITWAPPQQYQLSDAGDQVRAAALSAGLTAPGAAAARSAIAGTVIQGAEIDLGGFTAAEFLQVPQMAAP